MGHNLACQRKLTDGFNVASVPNVCLLGVKVFFIGVHGVVEIPRLKFVVSGLTGHESNHIVHKSLGVLEVDDWATIVEKSFANDVPPLFLIETFDFMNNGLPTHFGKVLWTHIGIIRAQRVANDGNGGLKVHSFQTFEAIFPIHLEMERLGLGMIQQIASPHIDIVDLLLLQCFT